MPVLPLSRNAVAKSREAFTDSSLWGYLLDAMILFALTLLILRPIALTNLIPGSGDAFDYFIPYRAYASHVLRTGHIPLWNPYLFMGVPFLANSQAAVLYPLHWPLVFLDPGRAVAWSIVIHVYLLAFFTYMYARSSMKLKRTGALTAGSIFAFGGFNAGAAMHLNQINALTWFPLALLLWDVTTERKKFAWTAGLGLVVAMMILAGHTQATFIAMSGIGLYGAWKAWIGSESRGGLARSAWDAAIVYAGAVAIGAMLSAAQLLPTMELSHYSLRQGGLTYRQAVSFSLRPTKLLWTLIPPYGADLAQKFGTPAFSEYIAYIPILGWVLALVGFIKIRKSKELKSLWFFPLLSATGFLLALGGYDPLYYLLYKLVPGFDLFRAPARWMFLTSFGVSAIAGAGVDFALSIIRSKTPRHPWRRTALGAAILTVLLIELKIAIGAMPISHPTAPEALNSMRNPVAFLMKDKSELGRVLSMSNTRYDTGDLKELERTFSPYLTKEGLYDLIVDTKEKEILAPNLSLYFGIQTVDGYDGGLLPLKRYNELLRLFLPKEKIVPDGRLREQLKEIPPQRLLNLLNVKYVITDKVYDRWIDGRYFDLQQSGAVKRNSPMTLDNLPTRAVTHIGIVWSGDECSIEAESTGGRRFQWSLTAGNGKPLRLPDGTEARLTALSIPQKGNCDFVVLEEININSRGETKVHGITLWNARTGSHWSLTIPRPANLKRVFSGDVKIYRNESPLPRAYIPKEVRCVGSDEAALQIMSREDFYPSREALIHAGGAACDGLGGTALGIRQARILAYEPERIDVEVHTSSRGYLILTDSYYPGWIAKVDGTRAKILRADLLFRAIEVPQGRHVVEFVYRPMSWKIGVGVSLLSLALLAIAIVYPLTKRRTK